MDDRDLRHAALAFAIQSPAVQSGRATAVSVAEDYYRFMTAAAEREACGPGVHYGDPIE